MCDHATVQDNLSDYPVLKNLLPEDYSHHVCSFESLGDSNNFRTNLKLRLTKEEQVQKWQEDFQASSGLTWRKSKTYPEAGDGSNQYRVDLRCHHNTRTSTTKSSKNTSCPAFMYLILKRQTYSKGRKSRSEDPHIKEGYYFHVVMKNSHNHHVVAGISCGGDAHTEFCEDVPPGDTYSAHYAGTSVLEDELARVFNSLTLKLRADPGLIAPLTSFIASYDKMSTDSALQSAFSMFGKSPMAKATGCQRPKGHLQTPGQSPVQPTAVGRRNARLGGRRALQSGRPSKASREDQPYKRRGRKPAAPHSLADCVEADMSLGGTH